MLKQDKTFRDSVYDLVNCIPSGKVVTYGMLAVLCGHPRAARVVGQIAHFGPIDMPWHRVVAKNGSLATQFSFGGIEGHRKLLEQEGIETVNYRINDMDKYIWSPKSNQ